MRRHLTTALVGAALAIALLPAVAADVPATKAAAKVTPPAAKSMAEKGSYHKVHEGKAKLECNDCHETEPLSPDTLNVRLHKPLAKGEPGPVKTDGCLVCHKKSGKGAQWYGVAPK